MLPCYSNGQLYSALVTVDIETLRKIMTAFNLPLINECLYSGSSQRPTFNTDCQMHLSRKHMSAQILPLVVSILLVGFLSFLRLVPVFVFFTVVPHLMGSDGTGPFYSGLACLPFAFI